MQKFQLNTVLGFNQTSGHPNSEIVGIDHYDFDAQDGKKGNGKAIQLFQ